MLEHIGEDAAGRISRTVESVLEERRCVTPDIGGHSRTEEMTQEIIRKL